MGVSAVKHRGMFIMMGGFWGIFWGSFMDLLLVLYTMMYSLHVTYATL